MLVVWRGAERRNLAIDAAELGVHAILLRFLLCPRQLRDAAGQLVELGAQLRRQLERGRCGSATAICFTGNTDRGGELCGVDAVAANDPREHVHGALSALPEGLFRLHPTPAQLAP